MAEVLKRKFGNTDLCPAGVLKIAVIMFQYLGACTFVCNGVMVDLRLTVMSTVHWLLSRHRCFPVSIYMKMNNKRCLICTLAFCVSQFVGS